MAIEEFEWQGEVELTEPSEERLPRSRRSERGDERQGVVARVRKSVWFEPALRLAGMALLLAVLAGIGMIATSYAKPGLVLPDGARSVAMALGTSWLKSTPVAAAVSAKRLGSAAPSVPPSAPPPATVPSPTEPPGDGKSPGITVEGKVILNSASAEELTRLPGVGMKRAQAIVALRTKLKRFKHPSDLLRVKGIGPRGLQRMLPHLVLD